ncbi:MAG: hypothetical protein ACRC5F_01245 [Cetobacterium sp.]
MIDFFNFRKIQDILKGVSEAIEENFEEEEVHHELCKICKKSVPNSDFSTQFKDEEDDTQSSRCLYCNKNFVKAREAIK